MFHPFLATPPGWEKHGLARLSFQRPNGTLKSLRQPPRPGKRNFSAKNGRGASQFLCMEYAAPDGAGFIMAFYYK
jgi:hypothetical protein